MIEEKKCLGSGRAKGFNSCGEMVIAKTRKCGLCPKCFRHFLFSDLGIETKEKFFNSIKNKVQTEKKAAARKEKQSIKKKSEYESDLQTLVNYIVRFIDTGKGCISCSHGWESNWHRKKNAGHRLSVGSNPALRYNVVNIFLQCEQCNSFKSGNEREYDKGLLQYYGKEMIDNIIELKRQYQSLKLTIEELKTAITNARVIKKRLLAGEDFTRDEINRLIGIYINNI